MYKVGHHEHTPIESKGFRWMPAAVDQKNHGGLGCYVRYKRYQDRPINVRHKSPDRILLECPDRDLLIVRDQHRFWPHKPAEGVWDEYVNFSPFWGNAQTDADLHYWMLNYTEYIGSAEAPFMRDGRPRAPHESFIVADSGGFQLSMGRLEWIDPLEVVKWYNRNVDLGMVLDIPASQVRDPQDFLTVAKAQQRNTQIMLDNKRPDLELLNILHGHDLERMMEFRKVVETPEIDRLAIGGAYFGTFMSSLDQILGLIENTRDHYHHYHVLGVWNLLQLIPLMRYTSHGRINLMTSDSSTPVQNANAKQYAYHPSINDTWQLRPIGTRSGTMHVNHHLTLPCHCQVCKTFKYMDVMSVLPGALMTHCLVYHNVYAMNNYVKAMEPIVAEASANDLVELMMAQLGNRRGIHEAKWGIKFADEVAANGYEKARKKFSLYITVKDEVQYENGAGNSLFGDDDTENKGEGNADDNANAQRRVDLANRYLHEADKYNALHGKDRKDAPKGFQVNVVGSSKQVSGKASMSKGQAKDMANKRNNGKPAKPVAVKS